ncbi:hypothetical protein DRF75_04860 [Ehrlichia minasensis]|uniref:Uncharacterized protein n=1 Tax=Ehrlichia minasensis TaxID=1242993 RepID=A0A4Q6I3C3_9RICK|nr:hypothetical protein DRF75_04860 [Ehrlichia minasensis]
MGMNIAISITSNIITNALADFINSSAISSTAYLLTSNVNKYYYAIIQTANCIIDKTSYSTTNTTQLYVIHKYLY